MMPRTEKLQGGVYAITDGPRLDLMEACAAVLDGGATMLQYRDKTRDSARRLAEARALSALCRHHAVPLIINDDVSLAAAVGADGVHLGELDGAIESARAELGPHAIIGASCYDDIERARVMARAGADYLAFGAFFPSSTKPTARRARIDLLHHARPLGLPLVAIGGITRDNAAALVEAGADYLAIVSALFGADDPAAATREIVAHFAGKRP